MNLAARRITQTATLLVLGLAASSVWAQTSCPPVGDGTVIKLPPDPSCPSGVMRTLSVSDPDGGGPAPTVYEAPSLDYVFLNCEGNGNGHLCEAWPQSDSPLISYEYSASGSISIPYPTTSPYISVSCWKGGQGSLTVTVYHGVPGNRVGTSTTQSLYCPF